MKRKIVLIIMLLMTALSLTGCIFTQQEIKYHEPQYYEFNLSKVELDPIERLEPKKYVEFLDKEHLFVKMPTWFYVKMLDVNDARNIHLKIYKKLYGWSLEDVERYNDFVKKQKKFFKELNKI